MSPYKETTMIATESLHQINTASLVCPLCDSPITRKQFVEVESRIRQQEQRKLQEQRRNVEEHQRKLDEEYRVKTEAFRIETQKKAKAEADARVLTMAQERDAAITRAKNVQDQAHEQTKKAVADVEAKLKEHQRKLDEDYLAKTQAFQIEVRNKAKAEADARVLTITKERDAAVAQGKHVQEQLKKTVADAETKVRDAMAKDYEKKDLARAADTARERESLQKKIEALQRMLADKSANELGDDAEIDLFEALRDTFRDDRFTRIKKGEPGADIKHEVMYKGVVAGVILFDSKNRKAWQSNFATKLRKDQVDAKADHAILSTIAFPSGKKELCLESGVILARPGRICDLASLLRGEIIKAHVGGLANQKRSEKKDALYQYIASEEYRQKTEEANRLANELLNLDTAEVQDHRRTWEKRGRLIKQQQRALDAISVEVSAIIEGKSA